MTEFDIVKATEIFLVPGSILVGALGVAKTEGLKTGVSALALLLTILWTICILDAYQTEPARSLRLSILMWMPALFLICWTVSLVLHGRRYLKERRHTT